MSGPLVETTGELTFYDEGIEVPDHIRAMAPDSATDDPHSWRMRVDRPWETGTGSPGVAELRIRVYWDCAECGTNWWSEFGRPIPGMTFAFYPEDAAEFAQSVLKKAVEKSLIPSKPVHDRCSEVKAMEEVMRG